MKIRFHDSGFPELVWHIVTELGSIIENAGTLGVPIPDFLRAAIQSLNQAVDGSDAKD